MVWPIVVLFKLYERELSGLTMRLKCVLRAVAWQWIKVSSDLIWSTSINQLKGKEREGNSLIMGRVKTESKDISP